MTKPKEIDVDLDYPFPQKQINLLMDLHKNNVLTKEQVELLNEIIYAYCNLRAHVFYGDPL